MRSPCKERSPSKSKVAEQVKQSKLIVGTRNEGEDDNLLEEPLLNGDSCVSKKKGSDTATPYSNACIFSILTFSWMGSLIAAGNKKTLDLDDVPQLDSSDTVVGITTLMLVKALFLSAWKDILLTALLAVMHTVASNVGPFLIDTFVQYLSGQHEFKSEGYLLVTAFFVAKLVDCICQRRWFFKLKQVDLRWRAVLIALIYIKGLTLSCQSKQSQTSGEIINFMTVDAERVAGFTGYMHDPWMVVLQVALVLLILYKNLGLASVVALGAIVLLLLANIPLEKVLEKFQDKVMKSKDIRMKATSEILRNMRILKLQRWELKFLSKIIGLRNVEEGWIIQEPISTLPDTISIIAQTKVSLDRIASFLRLDDLQPDVIEKFPRGSSDTAIEIVDGNFSWDLSSTSTLKDINLNVCHGMRVAVCGTVASGKSSLLSCILGELPKISGTLKLCGTKAYVAQSPWIQSGKIEENILFGKEMDRERYDRVLEACTLKKDLEILSFGDQTVIGERGINLIGGQKQRIQIARALYQDTDIYLFDDPFSVVDAHTGSHLFKEILLGILSSKTAIYVTHQVEFLPAADLILVMKDGRITQAGKYNDILNSGTDFMELVGAHKKALSALDTVETGSVSERSISEADGNNYWMTWATPVSADVKPPVGSFTLIMVYLAFAIASAFSILARSMFLNIAGYRTATLLFKKMHLCIFRAPMSFFDFTPSGRILNRASTDQSAVDFTIPYLVWAVAFSVIRLLGIIAVVSGATSIRCFDQESRFQEKNMILMDAYSRPKFHVAGAMEWLRFRLDMLSSITFAFSLFFLISIPEGVIDPSIAGLAVTYGLTLNILQARVIWNICSMENQIISVERMLQYSNIPSEPALVIKTNRPEGSWPSHGEVEILDLQVRYAPHMPLVLRGLTCTFPGGLKTGIVGRTGSGKSTLIQALFRIVEPAAGQIIIDGVNISSIGLHDLRSRLSIIPQDPTMFEGTVRSNLDPLDEYTDEQIWEALDMFQFGDEIRKKESRLDSTVSENGDNWSMGQRQLVCLGLVLLKKSKILVLDEATASVDIATDNVIQTTLKEHCTVITIAHRITSVLNSDMVLLLSNGLIEEYDSPARLLENKSSSFAQLVAEYTVRSNSSLEKLD
ncbi:hypothetical protein CRYUN_Cryun25bG0028200 [Craigia yunnanensis]